MGLLILVLAIILIVFVIKYINYRNSSYYKITKKPALIVRNDKGAFGEYCIYKALKTFEKNGAKFLFNVYLPKDNDETTEIDVLMICSHGIYVFESKNYSGWIFGNEKYKMWTQSLPQGKGQSSKKEKFLNPIMQNKLHIKCLAQYLNEELPMYSVVVFSNRCELKKIETFSDNIYVVKRESLFDVLAKNSNNSNNFDKTKINQIYEKLYPLTQVGEEIKQKHIDDINEKLKK